MHPARVWQVLLGVMLAVSPVVAADSVGAVGGVAAIGPVAEQPARACPNGYVALTFDDGPDAVTTPALVDELRRHGSRATFFVIGAKAAAAPEIVVLARSEGMAVGNHTYDHPFLDELSEQAVTDELTRTSAILDGMGGPAPTLFRPPYGRSNAVVERVVRRLGLTEVLWSYDSDDYEEASVEQMVRQAEKATDGEVLLFHDGYRSTVDAVPQILDVFDRRGLCAGQVLPSATPQQAWLDYDGDDKTYYPAVAGPW
jgi:endo-1,4-beta-xylanase